MGYKSVFRTVMLAMAMLPAVMMGQTVSTQIMVDQFGYMPSGPKVVVFANPIQGQNNYRTGYAPGSFFRVRRVSDNSLVYSNSVTTTAWSASTHTESGDRVWLGYFGDLTAEGDYYVEDATGKRSFPFHIGSDVYTEVMRHAGRMFYYQRCGTNIAVPYAGASWTHTECHVGTGQDRAALFITNGVIKAGTAKNVQGGWHDAGDFRKYVKFLPDVLWPMMAAAEENPDKFPDNWGLPESGNGVPDILDEVAYELTWLQKMQGTGGGVHSRVLEGTAWDEGTGFPSATNRRYYTEQTTWTTGIFAAIMAQAARIFAKYPAYATKAATWRAAATNAWNYLSTTKPACFPTDLNDGYTAWGPGSGCADANQDNRYRVWAAAELFRTTGLAKYNTYFTANYKAANTYDGTFHPLAGAWPHFDSTGCIELNQAFVDYVQTSGANSTAVGEILTALNNTAEALISKTNDCPYRVWIDPTHYTWGSTRMMADYANLAQEAIWAGADTSKDAIMRSRLAEYVNYYHGRNPLNWTYLTSMETAGADWSISQVYHGWFWDGTIYDGRLSANKTPPGILTGGPNRNYTPSSGSVIPPQNQPPMKAYKDWNTSSPDDSWQVTEPAIYYQAAYLMLLSGVAGSPGTTVSNFIASPSLITNSRARTVTFSGHVRTWSGYSVTVATLNLTPVGLGKVPMTDMGGGNWQYSTILGNSLTPGEYTVSMKVYNSQGIGTEAQTMFRVMPAVTLTVAIIYDGEVASKPYNEDYRWGTVAVNEVTNQPRMGAKILELDMPVWGGGIAHLAGALDGSKADTLEMWVRAAVAQSNYMQIQLYDTAYKASATVGINVKSYFWKVTIPVSSLTTGAEAGFDMSKVAGMRVMNNTTPGALMYLDDVKLTARMMVYGENADPLSADNTAASNVRFTCRVKSSLTNVSVVTLDMSGLSGPKTAMSNISGTAMTNFRYTYKVPAGLTPGGYQLPVIAYDNKGTRVTGRIIFTVKGPIPKVIRTIYDGETVDSDAEWTCWWGCPNTGVDDPAAGMNGTGLHLNFPVMGGGIQVATPAWWNGVDVTAADKFQFSYQSTGSAASLQVFSYDPVNGIFYSKAIALPATGGVTRNIATNLVKITQGQFKLTRVVGAYVTTTGAADLRFDDMIFTAMVEVKNGYAVPSVVTNTKRNTVQFWMTATSGNTTIMTSFIDLSSLGGPAKTAMTNRGGMTQFRYTYTGMSNRPEGTYQLPVWARDDKGYLGRGTVTLIIRGLPMYDELIVYDGDTFRADPERIQQWNPNELVFGRTGFLNDVGAGTTPQHGGTYSGMFNITNAGTTLFYIRDDSWAGIDATQAEYLEIWAKGDSGGETIALAFRFATNLSRTTNLTLTPTWNKWMLNWKQLTNGRTMGTNVRHFIGMSMTSSVKGSVVYLDDIRFVKSVKLVNAAVDPVFVLATAKTPVTVSCGAFSVKANITSVTLDATSLTVGGFKTTLSNLSGMTSFRYTFTTSSNTNLSGMYKLRVVAVDASKNSSSQLLDIFFFNPSKTTLFDFEAGETVWVLNYLGFASSEGWFAEESNSFTPGGAPYSGIASTAYIFGPLDGKVYHKDNSIGWTVLWDNPKNSQTNLNAANESWWANNLGGVTMAYPGWYSFIYMEPGKYWAQDEIWANAQQLSGTWQQACGPMQTVRIGQWTKVWIDYDRTFGELTSLTVPLGTVRRFNIEWSGGFSAVGQANTARVFYDWVGGYDPLPPKQPLGLTASDGGTGESVVLSWLPNADPDIHRYHIYQNTANNFGTAEFIGWSYNTSYTDHGVRPGTTYYYWILAEDNSENKGPNSAVASVTPTGRTPTVVYPYKGASLLAYPGEVSTSVLGVLTNIRLTGADTVAIPVIWSMGSGTATTMSSNAALTLSDADLRYLITNTRRMGMKVFLMPKLNVTGAQVYDIKPATPATWFGNYQTFIVKYATIAAALKVNLFSVGYELNSMATNSYDGSWTTVVNAITAVYSSNTVFCALPSSRNGFRAPGKTFHQTYRNLCVWNKVDYIGIDAAYPLDRYDSSPNLSKLYWDWNDWVVTNATGLGNGVFDINILDFNWVYNFEDWMSWWVPGQKVIFTEVKYASRDWAAQDPRWSTSANLNTQVQADCYEAFFRRYYDKTYTAGTFFGDWRPTYTVTTNFTPQGKAAYNVVADWYTPRPEHFAISHAGGGESMTWIPVSVIAHLADDTPVTAYVGTVTVAIDRGTPIAIKWTNLGSCGSVVNLGSGRASVSFMGCGGTVTLGIRDNTAETVNLRVHGSSVDEGLGTEDPNLIITGPLDHFVVMHDGWGVRNSPEPITVMAIDAFGNVKADYIGTVTLYASGTSGHITWRMVATNSTFSSNNGRACVSFRKSDQGIQYLSLADDTQESIDVEAKTIDDKFFDNDVNDPLHIIDFHSFFVVHDGAGLLGFAEDLSIKAADITGTPVYGYVGIVTVFISPATPPNGAYSLVLNGGNGTLTQVSANRWTYDFALADSSVVNFKITGTTVDTINIQVTDGKKTDLDLASPVNMVWQTHLYHYVKLSNPTPISPYTSPATAATAITNALKVSAPGDTVLIIDNAVYPSILIAAIPIAGRTIAGAPTNRPTIYAASGNAFEVAGGINDWSGFGLKNINVMAAAGYAIRMYRMAAVTVDGIHFENCYFSNNSASQDMMNFDEGANAKAGSTFHFYGNTFAGNSTGAGAGGGIRIAPNSMTIQVIGNTFRNMRKMFTWNDNTSRLVGNILFKMGQTGSDDGLDNTASDVYTPICNTTIYGSYYQGLIGDAAQFGITNCVSVNNPQYGFFLSGAGQTQNDYNTAFANTVGQFNVALAANDRVEDPMFVNAAGGDFRPAVGSPLIRSGKPNGTIRPNRGAHSWNVAPAYKAGSSVTTYTLMFAPFRAIPVGGQVKLQFPSSGSVAGVTGASSSMGTMSVSIIDDDTLLLTRTSGGIISAGVAQRIVIDGIKNPSIPSTTYSVICETKEGNSGKLDGDNIEYPMASSCYEIILGDLTLTSGTPTSGSTGIGITAPIVCTFDTNIGTADSTGIRVLDSGMNQVPCAYVISGKTVTVTPSTAYPANELITVQVTTNVYAVIGANLTHNTQWSFWTTTGPTTPHAYRTNRMDGSVAGYDTANVVGLAASGAYVYELVASDGADNQTEGATRQWFATWDTNRLFIALAKTNNTSAGDWYDYVLIDTTRDSRGATNNPPLSINPGFVSMPYAANRRPEFVVVLCHTHPSTPGWIWATNFQWTGSGWVKNAWTVADRSLVPGKPAELRMSWAGYFGGNVPNKISMATFVSSNGNVNDWCPESASGNGLGWITIDPDNDGNQIPDYMRVMQKIQIIHDGSGTVPVWDTFSLTCYDDRNGIYSNYTGKVTLSVDKGRTRLTNASGTGTFTRLSANLAVYQFAAGDRGYATFQVVSLTNQLIALTVKDTTGRYTNTAGNMVWSMPLSPADLAMSKSADVGSVASGGIITYKIVVTNRNPVGPSYDLMVIDQIPTGARYVTNSLKLGTGAGSTYAVAVALSDSSGNDQGNYDSALSRVVFCGDSGVAPSTAGTLFGGQAVSFFFKVQVLSNSMQPFVKGITNTDTAWDGTVENAGNFSVRVLRAAALRTGDTIASIRATNIYQISNNRDHFFSYDPEDASLQGYSDAATLTLGNAAVGGPAGQDNYHAFMTFALSGVPAGANITAATLCIQQAGVPTGTFDNPVHVDHVDYQNTYIATPLDAGRFNCTAPRSVLSADYASFNALAGAGWIRLPSTAVVQYAHANAKSFSEDGTTRVFQVMLRDNTEGTGGANGAVTFFGQNDALLNRPYLRVYFQVNGVETRGFTSFDLASITNIATNNITSVKLKMYRQAVTNNPSDVKVDHVNYGATPLGTNAYNAAVVANQTNLGAFAVGTGWAEVDVTAAVKYANKNSKGFGHGKYFQARLEPQSVSLSDFSRDVFTFAGAESAGFRPYLEVTYLQMGGPPSQIVNLAVLNAIYATNKVTVVPPSGTTVTAQKSVTNVTLKGVASPAKPGATVSLKIKATNQTSTVGSDIVVYDFIDQTYTSFVTNSASAGGWTLEYSTNATPVQTFTSPNYSGTQPSPDRIRWIRWKSVAMPGNSGASFRYNVRIR